MFQSTPPRGGRRCGQGPCQVGEGFNPRPRAGGDVLLTGGELPDAVSIHAPARGATPHPTPPHHRSTGFNPRPRAGGDLYPRRRPGSLRRFNPRPRAGGDVDATEGAAVWIVSIHAPARGATFVLLFALPPTCTFQSTPPRGGRLFCNNY